MNKDEILEEIEEVRQALNELAKTQNLLDSKISRVSQQLDSLLNTYHKLLNQK